MAELPSMGTGERQRGVDGLEHRWLERDGAGTPVVLVHGMPTTAELWRDAIPQLEGMRALAWEMPGDGRSCDVLRDVDVSVAAQADRLLAWMREPGIERERADVRSLTAVVRGFLDAVGVTGEYAVAGHDIGGAIAQRLTVEDRRVRRLALVNSVLYDSWPVPAVERFRDPDVVEDTSPGDLVEQRRQALSELLAHEPSPDERERWVEPWHDPDRAASWMAFAAAADARYTEELVPALRDRAVPTELIWGVDDDFQPLDHAERYAREIPNVTLHRVEGARHVPTHDSPATSGPLLRDAVALE